MRQLAKYGFVHQAAVADDREWPWRLVHTSHSVEGVEDKPGVTEALAVFEQVAAEHSLDELRDWQEIRASWSPGWHKGSGVGRSTVYLTEDEFVGLMEAIDGLLADYIEQRPIDDATSRPDGSRAVSMTLIVAAQGGAGYVLAGALVLAALRHGQGPEAGTLTLSADARRTAATESIIL